jgi:predicted nucleotidyltransferase
MAGRREFASAAEIIEEMVRRVVERFAPERVMLFGSRATGQAAADSDADLLVVMQCVDSPHAQAVEIRKALADLPLAKDVVVVTPEYFVRYRDVVGTIVWPAVRDGRTLYERAS